MILAVAAMIAACGSQGATGADAGVDAPGDTGAETGAAICDPAAQNCSAVEKCDFGCQGSTAVVACIRSTGGGAVGSACSDAMPCARGTGCLTAPNAGAACRKYCAGDGDCATGERCHNVTVAVACGGASTSLLLHYCY
jgi:hypothetical protein